MKKKDHVEEPRCVHPPRDRRPVAGDADHEWCEVCWEKVER